MAFYIQWSFYDYHKGSAVNVFFEISEGDSWTEVCNRLEVKGLIGNEWIFLWYAKKKKGTVKAGVYRLNGAMTENEIWQKLTKGETEIKKVTIPEGYRIEQIGQVLESKGLVKLADFLVAAKGLEGYLFPDTYYFAPDKTAAEIVEAMRIDFDERTADLPLAKEDLIIASIVEREAIKDEERPLIAGVYRNRTDQEMKLEADPTVQYGKDSINFSASTSDAQQEYKFWSPITKADYQNVISGYNTYKISALPPAPICNPGLKSIEATLEYAKHDYLYFFQANGQIYLSKTFIEHQEKIEKYLR